MGLPVQTNEIDIFIGGIRSAIITDVYGGILSSLPINAFVKFASPIRISSGTKMKIEFCCCCRCYSIALASSMYMLYNQRLYLRAEETVIYKSSERCFLSWSSSSFVRSSAV